MVGVHLSDLFLGGKGDGRTKMGYGRGQHGGKEKIIIGVFDLGEHSRCHADMGRPPQPSPLLSTSRLTSGPGWLSDDGQGHLDTFHREGAFLHLPTKVAEFLFRGSLGFSFKKGRQGKKQGSCVTKLRVGRGRRNGPLAVFRYPPWHVLYTLLFASFVVG